MLLVPGPSTKVSLKGKGGSLQGEGALVAFDSHRYEPSPQRQKNSDGYGWRWPGCGAHSRRGRGGGLPNEFDVSGVFLLNADLFYPTAATTKVPHSFQEACTE